jgi:hypothetical protein
MNIEKTQEEWMALFNAELDGGGIRAAILEFKQNGGSKKDAYLILDSIREKFSEEGKEDDSVLDMMDFVVGDASPPGNNIWQAGES